MKVFRFLLGLTLSLLRMEMRRERQLGNYQNGFIIIDLDATAKYLDSKGLTEKIALVRECEWTLLHELGHAIQIEATGDSDEESAEAFAREAFVRKYGVQQ